MIPRSQGDRALLVLLALAALYLLGRWMHLSPFAFLIVLPIALSRERRLE